MSCKRTIVRTMRLVAVSWLCCLFSAGAGWAKSLDDGPLDRRGFERKVTFEVKQMPLAEFYSALMSGKTGVKFEVAPEITAKITLAVEDMELRDILRSVAHANDLVYLSMLNTVRVVKKPVTQGRPVLGFAFQVRMSGRDGTEVLSSPRLSGVSIGTCGRLRQGLQYPGRRYRLNTSAAQIEELTADGVIDFAFCPLSMSGQSVDLLLEATQPEILDEGYREISDRRLFRRTLSLSENSDVVLWKGSGGIEIILLELTSESPKSLVD